MYEYALTPSVSVSFQRYPYPAAGVVTGLAPSCGALPFLSGAPQRLVLPSPDGEAFWIGLVTRPGGRYRLRVVVSTASGDRVDALTGAEPAGPEGYSKPPPHGVPGIRRDDGSWWAFARRSGESSAPACRTIELRGQSAGSGETAFVRVDVVEPEHFRALGGVGPPPLNEADRYGGWRLP